MATRCYWLSYFHIIYFDVYVSVRIGNSSNAYELCRGSVRCAHKNQPTFSQNTFGQFFFYKSISNNSFCLLNFVYLLYFKLQIQGKVLSTCIYLIRWNKTVLTACSTFWQFKTNYIHTVLVEEVHLKLIYEIKFKILFIGESCCFTQRNHISYRDP